MIRPGQGLSIKVKQRRTQHVEMLLYLTLTSSLWDKLYVTFTYDFGIFGYVYQIKHTSETLGCSGHSKMK